MHIIYIFYVFILEIFIAENIYICIGWIDKKIYFLFKYGAKGVMVNKNEDSVCTYFGFNITVRHSVSTAGGNNTRHIFFEQIAISLNSIRIQFVFKSTL